MIIILFVTFISLLFGGFVYSSLVAPNINKPKKQDGDLKSLVFVLLAALVVRLVAAVVYPGYAPDMSCFTAWSEMSYRLGLSNFYSGDVFADYPPGYIYVLYLLGFIRSFFQLDSNAVSVLLKLPAIIADLLCGFLVYKLALKRTSSSVSNVIAAFFLFNPAVILNSAVWGQVDSVITLLVIIMLFLVSEKKMILSYFVFAVAIIVKPQALFYTPVLIYGIIENVFFDDFSAKKFIKNLLCGLSAIALIFLLALPFGIEKVIEQYKNTLASYPHASVNAYNFWAALGLNWSKLTPAISIVGYVSIILTVAAASYIFFKKKDTSRYFFTSAFICLSVFMFSTKMHDRYAYPVMLLLLCSYAASKKPKELFLFFAVSAMQFINTAHVLFFYNGETYSSSGFGKLVIAFSFVMLVVYAFFVRYTVMRCKNKEDIDFFAEQKEILESFKSNQATENPEVIAESTKKLSKITKVDIIAICVITLVYSGIAFYHLGDTKAPKTAFNMAAKSTVRVNLGSECDVSQVKLFMGPRELTKDRSLTINMYDKSGSSLYSKKLEEGAVFFWTEVPMTQKNVSYMTLSTGKEPITIFEAALFDLHSERITSVREPDTLFDEQDIVPEHQTYMNSTYFDEIYHARTAYEFIHKLSVYEWTHPPLGKIFISIGVRMFGMDPFGWRIIGTLFGILMLPLLYVFVKKIFGMTWLSSVATLLFAFDFMHFAQTRIATIDVYVTFFIILMYLFMYRYYTMSFYDTSLKKTFVPLGLCGISMGLAIACKWTGIYAAAGLAIIFFITLFKRFRENKEDFKKPALKTIAFCLVMFVIVPLGIYVLSYIPYMSANKTGLSGILKNQFDMLNYHGKTVVSSTHPFSSRWYEWPIIARPIWYFSAQIGDKYENISSMGNPFVWWVGIPAFCYCLYSAIKYRDKDALFMSVGYIAQLAPWIPITRTTFIYHYFPCVPFLILMITFSIYKLYIRNNKIRKYVFIYTALVILLFVVFYPVISGFPTNHEYVVNFLRWLPRWQLITG